MTQEEKVRAAFKVAKELADGCQPDQWREAFNAVFYSLLAPPTSTGDKPEKE